MGSAAPSEPMDSVSLPPASPLFRRILAGSEPLRDTTLQEATDRSRGFLGWPGRFGTMTSGPSGAQLMKQLRALCDGGAVGGLTDGPLLDRFLARRDSTAE